MSGRYFASTLFNIILFERVFFTLAVPFMFSEFLLLLFNVVSCSFPLTLFAFICFHNWLSISEGKEWLCIIQDSICVGVRWSLRTPLLNPSCAFPRSCQCFRWGGFYVYHWWILTVLFKRYFFIAGRLSLSYLSLNLHSALARFSLTQQVFLHPEI